MVTNWENHWDNLGDNSTHFTVGMLRGNMNESKFKDNTKTIFIKRNKETKSIEDAWVGNVTNINKGMLKDGKNCIYFKIKIEDKMPIPNKYSNYSEGWYVDEEEIEEKISKECIFDPSFFSELEMTNDWRKFEEYTYYLIRCLGVHTSHRFGFKKQKGKADGFFKFSNFAVLYDCTLDLNFEKSKNTQIEKFCDQMKKGIIEYNSKRININHCNKNVWIITRTRNTRLIKEIDEIDVKEVPIEKIIELYRKRIKEDIDENIFEKELRSI
jgi:hypothetical protein